MRALALLCAAAETERHLHWRVVTKTPDVRTARNISRLDQVFALLGSRDSILCSDRLQAVTTRVRGHTSYRCVQQETEQNHGSKVDCLHEKVCQKSCLNHKDFCLGMKIQNLLSVLFALDRNSLKIFNVEKTSSKAFKVENIHR